MLSLERFAEVRAAIELTADRDAALIEAGIDAREWMRLQRHWLGELAEEIARGETDLAARYCRAFSGSAGAGPAAEPAALGEATPAGPVGIPSYLAAPAAPPHVGSAAVFSSVLPDVAPAPPTAAPAPFAGTAMVFELPRGPAVPFREGAPVAVPPAAPPPREPHPVQSGETAMVFELPRGPATPFPADPGTGSGTALDGGLPATGSSTPFAAPEEGPLGFTLQRYVELVAACQEPGVPRGQVLSRFGLDTVSFTDLDSAWKTKLRAEAGLTLEFHRRLADENKLLADRRREAAERPKRSGATVAIPVHNPPPTAESATAAPEPAKPQTGPQPPSAELTVEQYAWVVATLRKATSPAELDQALARFRLTAESRKQLEDRWRERMGADPSLQARFLTLLTGYLKGSGG